MAKSFWSEEENGHRECLVWEGPGWYAGQSVAGVVRTYKWGSDPDRIPEVYHKGYGTAVWLSEPFGEEQEYC